MFENILGNEKNKEILKKSVEIGRTSHSYIFWGTEGIGKKMIAKEFAKMILNNKESLENNPDFFILEPSEGKVKIEQTRELQKKIAEKPINSERKVYIINDADTMTTEAQNCLLKTLEEPPMYLTIILICSNENNLLSTIKSRCTRMYFEPISKEQIKEYIKENYNIQVNEEVLELSQGSISKTIKLLENQELYEKVKKILEEIRTKDLLEIVKMSEEIYSAKEDIQYILEYMNVLSLKMSKNDIAYIKFIDIIEETKKRLKANSNYDMCIDNLLFNMWEIERTF